MTTEDDLRAVATELLRLYDWRKELAKEEEDLQNTPIEQIDVREVAMREASDFEASPLIQRRAALDKKLRQYGREKKAAWERLRALLARPRPMPRTNPQHDCEYIDNPEKGACDLCEAFGDMYERGWNDCMMVARPLDARPVDEPPTTGYLHADRMSECGHCEPEKYMNAAPLEVCNCKCHAPIVPSASSPTNERVERLLDLLERAHDVIHRVGDESVATHNAITEELGRSHKEKV